VSIQGHQQAIAEMNCTKVGNHAILVVPCDVGTKKWICAHEGDLLVKNTDPSIDEAPTHDVFSNFGDVISVLTAEMRLEKRSDSDSSSSPDLKAHNRRRMISRGLNQQLFN
jgi:hypothetical protein